MRNFLSSARYWIQWHEIHNPAAVERVLFVGGFILAVLVA